MEINEMRQLLCERYSDCHYQPFQPNHPSAAHADPENRGRSD